MELWKEYVKEREDADCISVEGGILFYRKEEWCYQVVDIFVSKPYRRKGVADKLIKKLKDIAFKDDIPNIAGIVRKAARNYEEALTAAISYGFVVFAEDAVNTRIYMEV